MPFISLTILLLTLKTLQFLSKNTLWKVCALLQQSRFHRWVVTSMAQMLVASASSNLSASMEKHISRCCTLVKFKQSRGYLMCWMRFSSFSLDTIRKKSMELPCSLALYAPLLPLMTAEEQQMENPSYLADHRVSLVIYLLISTLNISVAQSDLQQMSLSKNLVRMNSLASCSFYVMSYRVKCWSVVSILATYYFFSELFLQFCDDLMILSRYLVSLSEQKFRENSPAALFSAVLFLMMKWGLRREGSCLINYRYQFVFGSKRAIQGILLYRIWYQSACSMDLFCRAKLPASREQAILTKRQVLASTALLWAVGSSQTSQGNMRVFLTKRPLGQTSYAACRPQSLRRVSAEPILMSKLATPSRMVGRRVPQSSNEVVIIILYTLPPHPNSTRKNRKGLLNGCVVYCYCFMGCVAWEFFII